MKINSKTIYLAPPVRNASELKEGDKVTIATVAQLDSRSDVIIHDGHIYAKAPWYDESYSPFEVDCIRQNGDEFWDTDLLVETYELFLRRCRNSICMVAEIDSSDRIDVYVKSNVNFGIWVPHTFLTK